MVPSDLVMIIITMLMLIIIIIIMNIAAFSTQHLPTLRTLDPVSSTPIFRHNELQISFQEICS